MKLKGLSKELILCLLIVISFIIRLFFIHPTFSENIYFNMGRSVLEGKIHGFRVGRMNFGF